MKSEYILLPVEDPKKLYHILSKTLGLEVVVDKKREVFLIDNVRVHLDEVVGLGTFIEFEAVYQDESERENKVKKVQDLLKQFEIDQNQLLDRSYVDYISMT